MDSKRQALAELFIELLAVIVQLGNFREHLEAFLHVVLLDHTQDLVLQQSLTKYVQRRILRIDDTPDRIQPLWNEVLVNALMDLLGSIFHFRDVLPRVRCLLLHILEFLFLLNAGDNAPRCTTTLGGTPICHRQ